MRGRFLPIPSPVAQVSQVANDASYTESTESNFSKFALYELGSSTQLSFNSLHCANCPKLVPMRPRPLRSQPNEAGFGRMGGACIVCASDVCSGPGGRVISPAQLCAPLVWQFDLFSRPRCLPFLAFAFTSPRANIPASYDTWNISNHFQSRGQFMRQLTSVSPR